MDRSLGPVGSASATSLNFAYDVITFWASFTIGSLENSARRLAAASTAKPGGGVVMDRISWISSKVVAPDTVIRPVAGSMPNLAPASVGALRDAKAVASSSVPRPVTLGVPPLTP